MTYGQTPYDDMDNQEVCVHCVCICGALVCCVQVVTRTPSLTVSFHLLPLHVPICVNSYMYTVHYVSLTILFSPQLLDKLDDGYRLEKPHVS